MKRVKRNREQSAFERVYFIGAGFSAGMHYPVGHALMSHLIGYLEGASNDDDFTNSLYNDDDGPDRAAKIRRVIERVLKTYFATKLTDVERVDVAEFFTLAQMLSERSWLVANTPAGTARSQNIANEPSETTLFADLASTTRSYFMDLSIAYAYPDDIKAVLGLVRPDRDAVINFNWDEEVDVFFSDYADDVSHTLGAARPENETLILKPHGSVGWYDVQQGIGNKDAYLIAMTDNRIERYDKRIIAYTALERPRDIDGSFHRVLACPPVITAPTFAKRFDYVEQQRIWQDVLEVCRNAKDFVFLGYSLPKDDFLTRAAIRAAITQSRTRKQTRCLVVDLSLDNSKLLNFLSVFEGFSHDRNYLKWEFGSDDEALADCVRKKLNRAIVGPP